MQKKEDSEDMIDQFIKRRKQENEAFIKLLNAMKEQQEVKQELQKSKSKTKN